MAGTAAGDQIWTTTGVVEIDGMGNFPEVPKLAQRDSFLQLTQGKAVYAKPGIGCRGPYTIIKMLIERLPDA
jgi:hypothetical protein